MIPKAMRLIVCVAAAGIAVVGCAHPRYYAEAERHLGTDGHFDSQGHFAVYYPTGIQLSFPGYVVGIELGAKKAVLRDGDLIADRIVHAGSSLTALVDEVTDGNWLPYVSQVIRYTGAPTGAGNCALYCPLSWIFATANGALRSANGASTNRLTRIAGAQSIFSGPPSIATSPRDNTRI